VKNGDRVQWQEGGAGQFTCTGTIINEEKYSDGSNPFGHFNIRVDEEHYLRACHTAHEMALQWVVRSKEFNKLRPLETVA
jgi:hypothetical protein